MHSNILLFILQKKYRIYAVNFNHQPPYLLAKWHIDVTLDPNAGSYDLTSSRLIVRGNILLASYGFPDKHIMVIKDNGNR